MEINIYETKTELGQAAAVDAARLIKDAISRQGVAHIIAATGASQFEFLKELVRQPEIDWSRTIFFHLDEYVGLPASHPASFRKYLRERLADKINPRAFHYLQGEASDPQAECQRLKELISARPIDVAFVGIGENGHLAFNDPPADFHTEEPYLVVNLDEACRRQQVGEGWFASLEEVPRQAISMSIRQILKAENILGIVPDERKAEAVRQCCEEEISPLRPASILRQHPHTTLYLDRSSASRLTNK